MAAAEDRDVRCAALEACSSVLDRKGAHAQDHETFGQAAEMISFIAEPAADGAVEVLLSRQQQLAGHSEAPVGAKRNDAASEQRPAHPLLARQLPSAPFPPNGLDLCLRVQPFRQPMLPDEVVHTGENLVGVAVIRTS